MNNQLIEQLAQKLGVTAEYLWSSLLRQAPISSTCDAIGLAVLGILLMLAMQKLKSRPTEDWEDRENTNIMWCIWVLLLIVFICLAITTVPMIFAGFFNPEYWALHQIIK